MGVRREGRELALQILYGHDLNPVREIRRSVADFWENHPTRREVREFTEKLVFGVVGAREEVDAAISARSEHWTLPRMAKIDLNILRIGVFELLKLPEVPKNVTINEAVEIAKTYGTEDSPSFVNGVLDRIASGVGKE